MRRMRVISDHRTNRGKDDDADTVRQCLALNRRPEWVSDDCDIHLYIEAAHSFFHSFFHFLLHS